MTERDHGPGDGADDGPDDDRDGSGASDEPEDRDGGDGFGGDDDPGGLDGDDDLDAFDGDDLDGFEDLDEATLDEHESLLVQQDLVDLENFEATFRAEGYRGVSVFCQDCLEDHFYPWDMLRENLTTLLRTGETPVHEPAFSPEPDQYVPWEYARGYVDALQDAGVSQRRPMEVCPRCSLDVPELLAHANFCPRCGTALLGARLEQTLHAHGLADDVIADILRETGLPG